MKCCSTHKIFIFLLCSISSGVKANTVIYSDEVKFSMLASEIRFPVKVSASKLEASPSTLQLLGYVDIQGVLSSIGPFMEREIEDMDNGCRERWSASNGNAEIKGGLIQLSVNIKAEKWLCERVLGKEVSTRLFRESGVIKASMQFGIVKGRIHLSLEGFKIDGLGRLARDFGVEKVARKSLQQEVSRFNVDAEKTSLPKEIEDLGYAYESIALAPRGVEIQVNGPYENILSLLGYLSSLKE